MKSPQKRFRTSTKKSVSSDNLITNIRLQADVCYECSHRDLNPGYQDENLAS